MSVPVFRASDTEAIRLQKLNELAARITGSAALVVDGGSSAGVSNPLINLDGGNASG